MKISTTYRFIASVLSLSILIGVSVPSGLHAMSEDVCDEMQEMHHMGEHGEDCPMIGHQHVEITEHQHHPKTDKTHHKAHDIGFACACSVEEAPIKTEAKAQLKTKVPVLQVVQILEEIHSDESEIHAFQLSASDAYLPPPIYLTNESFLI